MCIEMRIVFFRIACHIILYQTSTHNLVPAPKECTIPEGHKTQGVMQGTKELGTKLKMQVLS